MRQGDVGPDFDSRHWVVHVDGQGQVVFDFGWITSRDFDMARKTKIPGGHRLVVKETREAQ